MFKLFAFLIFVLFNVCVFVDAGLDEHDRWGKVIAYFTFDRMEDEGPKDYSVDNEDKPSIVDNGKFGKGMRMEGADNFLAVSEKSLSILTSDDFTIAFWLKSQRQTGVLSIDMVGLPDRRSGGGAVVLTLASDLLLAMCIDVEDDQTASIHTKEVPVFDNQWHHIVYTKNMRSLLDSVHEVYIDGEVVAKGVRNVGGFLGFGGSGVSVNLLEDVPINGSIFIDDLGFFETGFSVYEVKGLYEVGLEEFLTAMPVDPKKKVSTTWGEIKSGW